MSSSKFTPALIKIGFVHVLNGPNIWSDRPVLELEVDASGFPFERWSDADELLLSQGLEETGAAREWKSADGDRVAGWIAETALKMQCAGQTLVAFHAQRPSSSPSAVRLAVEFGEADIARAAVGFAVRWLHSVAAWQKLDLATEWEKFLDYAYDVRIGNSTGPIVDAAVAGGIPFLRLDTVSLVQLGHGCRQRRIRRAATDRTGLIGNDVSTNKELTKTILGEIGIPVPRGRAVSDAEDAVTAAREAGWPVVVKPQDADYGNGVTMRIKTGDEVRRAYDFARQHSEGVLVEHHVPGHLFRLLIVAGRLVAALRREPWYVVGDGKQTLLELIEAANFDARRGAGYVSPILLKQRELGEMPLLTPDARAHDSVPAADETVILRHDVYLKCGGIHLAQTELVHPGIVQMAVDATAAMGLDIAGLDVIAFDLTKSPQEQECVVLEVNSEPSIALHLEPLCVPSRPVGEAIVASLFASAEESRIPVTAVLGMEADFAVAEELARSRMKQRRNVGLASRDGAWLDGQVMGDSCASVWRHARRLWRHPRTEMAVIHVTLDDVLREGLPFDRCDELIECPSIAESLTKPGADPDGDRRRALDRARATLTAGHPWT